VIHNRLFKKIALFTPGIKIIFENIHIIDYKSLSITRMVGLIALCSPDNFIMNKYVNHITYFIIYVTLISLYFSTFAF